MTGLAGWLAEAGSAGREKVIFHVDNPLTYSDVNPHGKNNHHPIPTRKVAPHLTCRPTHAIAIDGLVDLLKKKKCSLQYERVPNSELTLRTPSTPANTTVSLDV